MCRGVRRRQEKNVQQNDKLFRAEFCRLNELEVESSSFACVEDHDGENYKVNPTTSTRYFIPTLSRVATLV